MRTGSEPCALCPGTARESGVIFSHVRRGERVHLMVALCESCGNRLEKHLKRAIPKRLMHTAAVADPPAAPRGAMSLPPG